ncbi:MAG TPA: RluA family pseudouridine synthase [Polyangiaceae bacterium]|nr:RluA family pseudouridine synthase [Polyangiaceae bacterium]
MPERFVLAVDQPRERIDKVLAKLLAPRSRATVQRWIAEGRVRLDGRVCRARDQATAGALVEVEVGSEPLSNAEPDPSVPFEVVFEDAHLIVVNKPAGIVVHPARGHRSGTLVSGLLARPGFRVAPADDRDPSGHLRPGIVHRIDKDTSGLLVVAKDAATREGLKHQLAAHSVQRLYQALTRGVPRSGRIETSYARHPQSRLRFTSKLPPGAVGKRAVTHVSVLESFGGSAAAWIECRLETGRTHQIRVHLAERMGTPLLADALYGAPAPAPGTNPELESVEQRLGRHALHARVLGFRHPITGQSLLFESALPADLEAALVGLRELRPTTARR